MSGLALDTTTYRTLLDAISSMIASLDALSTMNNTGYCKVCLFKNNKMSQCSFILENKPQIFGRFRDSNHKQLPTRTERTNPRSEQRKF